MVNENTLVRHERSGGKTYGNYIKLAKDEVLTGDMIGNIIKLMYHNILETQQSIGADVSDIGGITILINRQGMRTDPNKVVIPGVQPQGAVTTVGWKFTVYDKS